MLSCGQALGLFLATWGLLGAPCHTMTVCAIASVTIFLKVFALFVSCCLSGFGVWYFFTNSFCSSEFLLSTPWLFFPFF